MSRVTTHLLAAAIGAVILIGCTAPSSAPDASSSAPAEPVARPWTHLDFLDGPEAFQFAVVADRAGWHRPGVFERALDRLEALGPAFVISVGDLVDTGDFGENPDLFTEQSLEERWIELDAFVNDLSMPFFYVTGNNEMRDDRIAAAWVRRLGRSWYHFRYQDALFIVLDSEDPPGDPRGAMSDAQLAWLRETLAANSDVRWTFLFLHKRMWLVPDYPVWAAVEEALGSRPRTVFAGHAHRYSPYDVNGHVYYGLATTGGNSSLSGIADGRFDHVVWVRMTGQGPRITNLMLDGMWGDDPASEIGN